jgi:hypothetical protein
MTIQNRYSAFNIVQNNIRKDAYNILSNKDVLKCKLYKTKMCNKQNCTNKHCKYAHNESELRKADCFFGDKCIYKNSINKPCKFHHPSDDNDVCKVCSSKIFIKKIIL